MKAFVDCAGIADAAAMHRQLAQVLVLPEWYGHNLDALYDCLTELEGPVSLTLKNWDAVKTFAAGFADVFENARRDNPDFTVEYQ